MVAGSSCPNTPCTFHMLHVGQLSQTAAISLHCLQGEQLYHPMKIGKADSDLEKLFVTSTYNVWVMYNVLQIYSREFSSWQTCRCCQPPRKSHRSNCHHYM